jgi:hypothetical protein
VRAAISAGRSAACERAGDRSQSGGNRDYSMTPIEPELPMASAFGAEVASGSASEFALVSVSESW